MYPPNWELVNGRDVGVSQCKARSTLDSQYSGPVLHPLAVCLLRYFFHGLKQY
jgi:hypothetical protein